MPVTTVQGKLIPLKISTDAGVTKKSIVCLIDSPFESDKAINREQSQCGTHTAMGDQTWGWDVSGIVNLTPTGASEVSFEDLLALHVAETQVAVYMDYPVGVGTDFYISGNAWLSRIRLENPVGGLARFTARLEGDGTMDIAA
jgi:hypothetical protein